MGEVIDFKESVPHAIGIVECQSCFNEYQSVHPIIEKELECPVCKVTGEIVYPYGFYRDTVIYDEG